MRGVFVVSCNALFNKNRHIFADTRQKYLRLSFRELKKVQKDSTSLIISLVSVIFDKKITLHTKKKVQLAFHCTEPSETSLVLLQEDAFKSNTRSHVCCSETSLVWQ